MVLLLSCAAKPAVTSSSLPLEPKVSTYLRTWPLGLGEEELVKGEHWTADGIHGEYLTDVIVSFALIDQTDKSTLYVPDMEDIPSKLTPGATLPGFKDLWEQVAALKEKYPHIKVNLSVGGYGAEFSDTADDPELRGKLIANICDWLEKYNLDGIDIDWEYPVGPDWGADIKVRPGDRGNFITLLTEIRTAIDSLGEKTGKYYPLSIAVPVGPWYVEKNRIKDAAQIVDTVKLMAYDYSGAWSPTTGHHANLYGKSDPRDQLSTKRAVDMYIAKGIPANKISVGIGFYGHVWEGVPPGKNGDGLYQKPGKTSPLDGLGWDKTKELLKPDSGYTRYWDDVAKAPYLYNGDTFITYTDQEAIGFIADYVKEQGLGGVFVWEYAHDMDAELLKPLAEKSQ
jgi:chitinase